MHRIDVTQAILMALADAHPQGVQADALARMVSCEREALQRPLRLLEETGAIRCAERSAVQITDAAMSMLKHEPS